jgi:hypothetical protein
VNTSSRSEACCDVRRRQRDAAWACGATSLANELLGFVRGSNPYPIEGAVASEVVPMGKGASSITVGLVGASRCNTTDRAWNRRLSSGRAASDGSVYYYGPVRIHYRVTAGVIDCSEP